jgi:hypothetical protein
MQQLIDGIFINFCLTYTIHNVMYQPKFTL